MIHSSFQDDLFAEISTMTGHVIVEAVAGSGKTYSLLESMKIAKGDAIFLSFNKIIQLELAGKVPAHVQAKTLHSIGLSAIHSAIKGYKKIDKRKINWIMNKVPATMFTDAMTDLDKALLFQKREQIKKLVSIFKNTMIDYMNNEEVMTTADHFGVNFDPANLGIARSIMEKSIADIRLLDFDDMIYMPVAMKLPMPKFSYVFVDECQDLNRTQIELVMQLVRKPNGRIIAVGDSHQSIYGFRGADVNAMARIQEVLNAKKLPLSICYRCPTSHVKLAQEIVPDIQTAPDAKEGTINHIGTQEFFDTVDKETSPLVLCRTNAPLISHAIKMIKQGKKAHVRGADIGEFLKGLIIGFKASTIAEFNSMVDSWENAQLESLTKRRASESVKETILDYADVLRVFAEQSSSPNDIAIMIDKIFSDEKDGTIFSTVHKAKGLQAESVYILRPDLLPLIRKGQKDWELEQEMNLKYVALTRSKDKLTFVND